MNSRRFFCSLLASAVALGAVADDMIRFGNAADERSHAFQPGGSEIVTDGLGGRAARRLLPSVPADWQGGAMKMKIAVDPVQQNYLTLALSGSDTDENLLIAYLDGKQLGYRHLGDVDILSHPTADPGKPGNFFFTTQPLPPAMTKGKRELELEIRSTGRIWGYGRNFEQYQKPMKTPTRGIYLAAVHTDPAFAVPPEYKLAAAPVRPNPPEKVDFTALKARVNREVDKFLRPNQLSGQPHIQLLAHAWFVPWTRAYHNPVAVQRVVEAVDRYFVRFRNDRSLAIRDKSTYNPEWFGFGPIGDALRLHRAAVEPLLDAEIKDEKGNPITRRAAYAEMFNAALDYLVTHRRQYTNQSMIIDMSIHLNNEALRFIAPDRAYPRELTLRFLEESVGVLPWSGSLDKPGKDGKNLWPLGKNYYQLTPAGLTRELGYVGTYGEVLDWMGLIYNASRPAWDAPGDPEIGKMIDKALAARAIFRYPVRNADGTSVMRLETMIGWRDNYFPGPMMYAERFSRESSGFFAAVATGNPRSLAYARQVIDEGQLMRLIQTQMSEGGIRVTLGLLLTPGEYDVVRRHDARGVKLPMSAGQPDFVWADDGDGVIAFKDGETVFYASLYWRSRHAVNFLARVHEIRPEFDRIATVRCEIDYTPQGIKWKRPDYTNFGFANGGPRYPGKWVSALAGEELPVARIPEGVSYKNGAENIFAGKGDFYRLAYGDYAMALNAADAPRPWKLPRHDAGWRLLPGGATAKSGETVTVPAHGALVYKKL